jgi:hypothetical protein
MPGREMIVRKVMAQALWLWAEWTNMHSVAAGAEDEAHILGVAPGHRFRPPIMTVAADGGACVRPVSPDPAHQLAVSARAMACDRSLSAVTPGDENSLRGVPHRDGSFRA